ncbi:hypothetical protein ACUDTL_16810 [Stenotrophomonas pavanii]|uniref:hypothetical protein n=1 Tax=Stenotrophomonas pavanii TaxID=487698 RepID=UPI0040424870
MSEQTSETKQETQAPKGKPKDLPAFEKKGNIEITRKANGLVVRNAVAAEAE